MLCFWIEASEDLLAGPLIAKVEGQLKESCWPVWMSDGFDAYGEALKDRHAKLWTYPRTGRRGRPRKPRLILPPELRYAQVVKQRNEMRRVTGVFKRMVFGTVDLRTVSTVYVERHNLNLRHENRRLTRKTIAFSKEVGGLEAQMIVYQAYYNFVRVHRGLRRPAPPWEHSIRKWHLDTPAVACNITDHPWSLRELMVSKIFVHH